MPTSLLYLSQLESSTTMGIAVSPEFSALVMPLSTVIVAINSQTLRKYEPQSEI